MKLLSINFVILWVIFFALYYLAPKKRQWMILAVASGLFYVVGTGGIPIGILLTGAGAYGCGIYLKRSLETQKEALSLLADKEKKKTLKQGFEKRRKRVQILYFVCSLGILALTKYMVVILPVLQGAGLTTPRSDAFFERVVMPLGVSFYTLTAIGYVVDVGREQCRAEENPAKLFLFLAYFPAITQGPFNRYVKLQGEFEREHVFDYERMLFGVQRFVWGAFKKLVIADRINLFVGNVFEGAGGIPGSIYALAVVFYMIQLYADFSGYMDMALGISETFDIFLPENFKRPYFSKSVAEFWRRWHITLGTWFKDYVMFSFVMSGTGRKIGKSAQKRWPKLGKHVTGIVGTMLVWLLTGMWHGRTVSYILWGIYYGVIMCVSLVLEPQYGIWKEKLSIKEGKLYSLFCMARTWVIVFVADVLIRSESLSQAGMIYRAILMDFRVREGILGVTSYGLSKYAFLLLAFSCLLWLAVSVWEEREKDVRRELAACPMAVRWCCYYGVALLLLITGIYGGSYDTAAFLYQSF
jgi:D-alanyl-lipoteichoic acid acyltransferase DltB (MBOAT superfamily)